MDIAQEPFCGNLEEKCRTPGCPPRSNTGPFTVTVRTPSVWPHCLGKKSVADLNISEACQNHGHLSATTFAVRRLLHSKPGDDPFGIHKTVKDADGNFQSALRLTNRAQAAARLGNREYKGEVCSSKMEADVSAARVFWEELRVQERAEKLEPSKKVRKEKDAAQSAMQSAKRDGMAHARRVHRKGSESHQSPVASLTLRHFHRISVG